MAFYDNTILGVPQTRPTGTPITPINATPAPAVENKFKFGTSFKSAGTTNEGAYWMLVLRLN